MSRLDKSYKVRVSPTQSANIQHLGFKCGFNWWCQKDEIINAVKSEFLSITKDGIFCVYGSEDAFEQSSDEKIEYEELMTLLKNLAKAEPSDTTQNSDDGAKFKVGDKVYCPSLLDGGIYTVRSHVKGLFVGNDCGDCYSFLNNGCDKAHIPIVFHANEENRQALQVLHPDIEFEQPSKELKGDDLAKAMLKRGDKYIVADCDPEDGDVQVIYTYKDGYFYNTNGYGYVGIVPIDPRTGEPLTEAVLDE